MSVEKTFKTFAELQEHYNMRLTNLYQMYDLEAQAVAGPIIIEKRDAPAIRAFYSVLQNADTLPGKYPEHFELRKIGEQDEETAQLTTHKPDCIATGRAWLEQQKITSEGH